MSDARKPAAAAHLMTSQEAAAYLSIDVKQLYTLVHRHQIQAIDMSIRGSGRRKTFRFSRVELDRFLKSRTVGVAPANSNASAA